MKRYKHLFEQVCSFENLHAAAYAALRGKRGKKPAAAFFANLEEELVALRFELLDGTYRHGDYHYFQIHEPKERRVAAAPFRDRVVHHAIVRVVEPLFEARFIEDSFACRKGKGTHAGMRRAAQLARKYPYALKCDIRKYFANIDHEILSNQLARVIGDQCLLDLMNGILASHSEGSRMIWGDDLFSVRRIGRGLPIGNLTSQFWANVYLNALDHFVKHELRCKGYIRYMDDFLLFSHNKVRLKVWGRMVRKWVPRQPFGVDRACGACPELWISPCNVMHGKGANGIKRRSC
jgi:retron-type reverse transcriptase